MADRKGTRVCGRCLSRGWYRKGQLTVDCERGCPRVEPTPVRLSADMLGEEDRRNLLELRNLAYLRSIQLCGALRHDAKACIAWADRLLNK